MKNLRTADFLAHLQNLSSGRRTHIIAFTLLGAMFVIMLLSMRGDALTFDELAHIPAGYSYLTQRDYRINSEHPPLVKDLAALPLLALDLHFPTDHHTWTQEEGPAPWWFQFDLGTEFLYRSGNDPKDIILFSRIPMILLTLFLGWFLFFWARKLGGDYVGLGALVLFTFSPTFLAHGRLVTTDVGAALGAVLAMYFWLEFLKQPKGRTIFAAGIAFGIAMALKFTLVLLVPVLAVITIVHALGRSSLRPKEALKQYAVNSVFVGVIALFLVIVPLYSFHVANYPPERQARDTAADLGPGGLLFHERLVVQMAEQPALRPLAQYLRGILMAGQRAAFGNTTYFLGEVSATAWRHYFPVAYLVKIPLAFHILTLVGLFGIWLMRKKPFVLFAFASFIALYWLAALVGNLNIGIRHMLPVLPFTYILILLGLQRVVARARSPRSRRFDVGVIALLFLWYIVSSLATFPHYISYYNELAGGAKQGYKIAVDSNYDWGQDFYRLLDFVEKNNIEKLQLDYFGGEDPTYWLREKYVKLEPKKLKKAPTGWVAVSSNQLQGGLAKPAPGFDQQTGYYNWLLPYAPVARAGNTIFIYNIE